MSPFQSPEQGTCSGVMESGQQEAETTETVVASRRLKREQKNWKFSNWFPILCSNQRKVKRKKGGELSPTRRKAVIKLVVHLLGASGVTSPNSRSRGLFPQH